ncbi:MAG: beta-ureidopropionase / N-carbamoyl-L-amino-acid hydrolase [Actinomycetota bacterium]|nr:beta-ureidopropionase / N-carbamoyl-L-amino-acid hydrolase [Actinomycetota bacterium]
MNAALDDSALSFDRLWSALLPIGRTPSGGYRRFAWNAADLEARAWFVDAAAARGLDVQTDRNGNLWAWWLPPTWSGEPRGAFVTGSHLDSVPDGGGYDGPLGVISALCAIDLLRARGVQPVKPVAVVVFADEEGARFGVACTGSRLATGALSPDLARSLTDTDGVTLDAAMQRAGFDARHLGRDDESLARVGVFVELHIEQGRALVDLGAPVGIATGIWPHGRWRFSFDGEANHAGTTRLVDRRDPMLPFAAAALAARDEAEKHGGVATVGRVHVVPNGTNAVPSSVTCWLDARAPDQGTVDAVVRGVEEQARARADAEGVGLVVAAESVSPAVEFSAAVGAAMHATLGGVPDLGTGAGHDAGVLATSVATGMLFVRNPTGVSHSPEEFAERADCLAGVAALAAVMADWTAT